jgi:hypothetical protein
VCSLSVAGSEQADCGGPAETAEASACCDGDVKVKGAAGYG